MLLTIPWELHIENKANQCLAIDHVNYVRLLSERGTPTAFQGVAEFMSECIHAGQETVWADLRSVMEDLKTLIGDPSKPTFRDVFDCILQGVKSLKNERSQVN